MSNYTNNPFADALSSTASEVPSLSTRGPKVASSSVSLQPRSYKSVLPPVNRATKESVPPPPSYEEAAGREAAKAPYRDEKEHPRRSNGEHRSSHRHRSHSESEHHRPSSGKHHSSREYHSTSRSGEKSRHHSSRNGSSSKSKSEKKSKEIPKPKNLDTIDRLDVTGLFGGGFHHDGPFEACTPFRNKDKKAAPVMAFPADGPNSAIKGASQPIKEQLIDYAFGVPNEVDLYQTSKTPATVTARQVTPPSRNVYSNGQPTQSSSTISAIKNDVSVFQFDSSLKSEPIHGQTTLGLGSSTFIDGAPAPKVALIEDANQSLLSRKKSLVHRVKSIRRKN